MNVAEYTINFLQKKGIKRIYGVTGGAIMFLTEAIRNSNIEFIPMLHEQGVGIAAESESIYNNSPAVLLTTAGPGITNAITPITSAWIDGNPLLVISGQCKTSDSAYGSKLRTKGIQETSAVEITTSITKFSDCIWEANRIKEYLDICFYHLENNRKGPVFLEIPLNIQNEDIDKNNLKNWISLEEELESKCEGFTKPFIDNEINKLIDILNKSQRPVILAGNGIRQSGALEQFKKLKKELHIPILLTWKTLDFFGEDENCNFGRPGSISSRYANNILQSCDLLISIGARLDYPTTAYDHSNFAKNAKKVIIDIDQAEIDKLEFKKELVYYCDAKIFIEKLLQSIDRINYIYGWRDWRAVNIARKICHPICLPEFYENKEKVNPYVFIKELSNQCKEDDIIVAASSGSASEMMAQAFEIKEGQRFISSNGLGSMGFGICHSIGSAFASDKKKKVICVEGDGSFFMNVQHLQTIRQYNLPIIIFVWSNGEYKSIRDTHMKFFGNKIACDRESGLELPSIQEISKSYGIDYLKLGHHNGFDQTFKIIDRYKNIKDEQIPMIIEVMIDKNVQTQPRVQSFVDKNGNLQSGKLENMWPFLGEEK